MSDDIPPSKHNKIPRFLYLTYIILIVWGIWAFFIYWNGASGVRGRWRPLQEAAETTYPWNERSGKTDFERDAHEHDTHNAL